MLFVQNQNIRSYHQKIRFSSLILRTMTAVLCQNFNFRWAFYRWEQFIFSQRPFIIFPRILFNIAAFHSTGTNRRWGRQNKNKKKNTPPFSDAKKIQKKGSKLLWFMLKLPRFITHFLISDSILQMVEIYNYRKSEVIF